MTKLSELKEGDFVISDDEFTCMGAGKLKKVRADANGELYIHCDQGDHYLEGQIDECSNCGEDFLVGLTKL